LDKKITVCPGCGKPLTVDVSNPDQNYLPCLPLDPRLVQIVLGRNYIVGTGYVYVDGNSKEYSKAAFEEKFKLDPEAIWREVQERRGGPTEPIVIKSQTQSRPRPGTQVFQIGRGFR
jgi:hypothetical protein